MLPYYKYLYANPSNKNNLLSIEVDRCLESARDMTSKYLGADSQEIFFTSGASETINTIFKGIFLKYKSKGKKIVTTSVEHSAVLRTLEFLETQGAEIITVPVNEDGQIDLELLESKIDSTTIIVSVILANNETGVIQDINKISEIVHDKGSILFSDATQAAGKIALNFRDMGIDAACISAHKFHGPKGVGAMYLSRKQPRVSLSPLLHGGGQERGLRAGTHNVTGIIGLYKSLELAHLHMQSNSLHMLQIRQYLETELKDIFSAIIIGENSVRLPNTICVMLPKISNTKLLSATKTKFAISLGSACSASLNKTSHVIRAMGFTEEFAKHTFRISLSRYNTMQEAISFINLLKTIL
jgi:cysteine desulfurase